MSQTNKYQKKLLKTRQLNHEQLGLECTFFVQTQHHLFGCCNILIAQNSGRENEANSQPTHDVTPGEIAAG